MKTIIVHKKLLWLIPYSYEVERPHIRRCRAPLKVTKRYGTFARHWLCEGAGQIGFGATPMEAWNDWANWALI